MFINLAPHERRGTANSDDPHLVGPPGVGIGIIGGGSVAEHLGNYSAAFWLAFAINIVGVLFFYTTRPPGFSEVSAQVSADRNTAPTGCAPQDSGSRKQLR